jgi:hypothetical protein
MTYKGLIVLAGASLCAALTISFAPAAMAVSCKTDATDGCDRPGLACDPPKDGKCVTVKTPVPLSSPKLSCECQAAKAKVIERKPLVSHPVTPIDLHPVKPVEQLKPVVTHQVKPLTHPTKPPPPTKPVG